MTPPDTDMQKDKRRHRGPVIVVILLIAVVLLGFVVWMGGVFETAPGPDDPESAQQDETSSEQFREGDVEVPESAPTETVEPGDPDTDVSD